jgi:hypothetical protein
VAGRRAEALLRAHLDEGQLQDWEANKQFYVMTPNQRRYRIRVGLAGNVRLVSGGPVGLPGYGRGYLAHDGQNLCAHVSGVPIEDNLLTQKLLLEAPGGEEQFLAMANPHG